MQIPATFPKGDSRVWDDEPVTFEGVTYDSAGYALTYELRGAAVLTLAAVSNGTGWRTTLTTTASATLTPGAYAWSAVMTAAGERVTVATGTLNVSVNLADQSAGYEARSTAKQILDALDAYLIGQANANQLDLIESAIAQRSIRRDRAGLLEFREQLKADVQRENDAASVAAGLGNPRRYYVRNGGRV